MGSKYQARCSWKPCPHLSVRELKDKYHCDRKGCWNYSEKCEQHSADGVKLLNARLDKK